MPAGLPAGERIGFLEKAGDQNEIVMDEEDEISAAAGLSLLHTMSHPFLSRLDAKIQEELSQSRRRFGAILGRTAGDRYPHRRL